ncbi:putative serine/threonine-protein kinase PBL28 [Bidens hawaiensis]|uniref:putative serine/threonine-protein kinase PBL28 n=1 Tax=Bidens hawaiensis TaxID=980011 RepID=UPI00404AA97B
MSSSFTSKTAIMSFDDYFSFSTTPLKEIISATNNFADENLLSQGTSYNVYIGRLLQSGSLINIVARKCPQINLVINELIYGRNLKHKNVISVFMIARTEDMGIIIINKHEANESLDKHLRSPALTWMQRLHICVGVARALSYLHYDAEENYYVIHGNIKSSKILLDHNWEPKLHGFTFAVRAKKHYLCVTSKYNGSLQYMDPAYEYTRGLTNKSDVFSFGVLLFEVLFGREASIQNNDNWYFARLARLHYEEKNLDDLTRSSKTNELAIVKKLFKNSI